MNVAYDPNDMVVSLRALDAEIAELVRAIKDVQHG